jgi:hypothetical protein
MWIDPALLRARAGRDSRPTLYPGTDNPADAVGVRVNPGETVRSINVQLVRTEWFRLAGQALRGNSDGPIEANIVAGGQSVRTVTVAEDGAFDISHLKPGRYTLWMRAATPDGAEAAVVTIDLSSDLTGLTLPLTPTGEVSGRVVTRDGSPLPEGLQVTAVQADEGKQIDPLDRDRVDVGEDGRFVLRGLFGERILRVLGLGPEWELDRVLHGKKVVQSFSMTTSEKINDVVLVVKGR